MQQKPPVLIIENTPPTLELYRRELSRNFQVLACEDGNEALSLAGTPDWDFEAIEPALSNNLGWKVFFELKGFLKDRPVPIILYSTLDEGKRGLEAGAADFLVKPVLPNVLVKTLHRVIRLATKV